MKRLVTTCLLAASALAPLAWAQPGPGASGPRPGAGPRYGADVTPGWGMMTAEEREAHRKAMTAATTQGACAAERDRMHQLMNERAKERGHTLPAKPRRDACAGLPK